jgi:hypothetical protein
MATVTQPFGQKLSAGDRWSWTLTLADYPATAWKLTYAFRGPSKLDVVSVASGTDHQLDALPAVTGNLEPGVYAWQAAVENLTDPTQHYELGRGTIEILGNILKAGADGPVDFRSQNQRVLDAIRKTIEGTASREEQHYQIGGRSLQVRTVKELLDLEGTFAARVKREQIEAGTAGPNNNMVHVRFGEAH